MAKSSLYLSETTNQQFKQEILMVLLDINSITSFRYNKLTTTCAQFSLVFIETDAENNQKY